MAEEFDIDLNKINKNVIKSLDSGGRRTTNRLTDSMRAENRSLLQGLNSEQDKRNQASLNQLREQTKSRGFNIDAFRTEIATKGILPTTHFILFINDQFGGVKTFKGATATADTLAMRCEAANIPGVSLMMQDVIKYGYGPITRMPHALQYPMLTLTFMMDQEGAVHKFFKEWIGRVIRHDSKGGANMRSQRDDRFYPYQVGYKKDYAIPQMTLAVYDRQLTRTLNITFYDVFPVQLNDIQLSWAEQDTPMRFAVTLSFTDMDVVHEKLVEANDAPNSEDPNNEQTYQQKERKKSLLGRLFGSVGRVGGTAIVDAVMEEGIRKVDRITDRIF